MEQLLINRLICCTSADHSGRLCRRHSGQINANSPVEMEGPDAAPEQIDCRRRRCLYFISGLAAVKQVGRPLCGRPTCLAANKDNKPAVRADIDLVQRRRRPQQQPAPNQAAPNQLPAASCGGRHLRPAWPTTTTTTTTPTCQSGQTQACRRLLVLVFRKRHSRPCRPTSGSSQCLEGGRQTSSPLLLLPAGYENGHVPCCMSIIV